MVDDVDEINEFWSLSFCTGMVQGPFHQWCCHSARKWSIKACKWHYDMSENSHWRIIQTFNLRTHRQTTWKSNVAIVPLPIGIQHVQPLFRVGRNPISGFDHCMEMFVSCCMIAWMVGVWVTLTWDDPQTPEVDHIREKCCQELREINPCLNLKCCYSISIEWYPKVWKLI